jgi:hypothetical protein
VTTSPGFFFCNHPPPKITPVIFSPPIKAKPFLPLAVRAFAVHYRRTTCLKQVNSTGKYGYLFWSFK